MADYAFIKEMDVSFESAVETITECLRGAGFGILTTIDVKEKIAHKVGIDMENYQILGVCDLASAQKAICAEQNIGLLLPWNVIVYEYCGKVIVAALRPTAAMQMIDNMDLHRIARDIERRLKVMMETLQPVEAPS